MKVSEYIYIRRAIDKAVLILQEYPLSLGKFLKVLDDIKIAVEREVIDSERKEPERRP